MLSGRSGMPITEDQRKGVVVGVLLMLAVVVVGVVLLTDPPAQPYYKHIAIAETALHGGRVLVSDLNNVQDMIKHDDRFKKALLEAGFTEEKIRRLVGEEFLYIQVKP